MIDLGRKDQVVVGVGGVADDDAVDRRSDNPCLGIETVDISQGSVLSDLVQGFEKLAEADATDDLRADHVTITVVQKGRISRGKIFAWGVTPGLALFPLLR